jgi:hypothetical protein
MREVQQEVGEDVDCGMPDLGYWVHGDGAQLDEDARHELIEVEFLALAEVIANMPEHVTNLEIDVLVVRVLLEVFDDVEELLDLRWIQPSQKVVDDVLSSRQTLLHVHERLLRTYLAQGQ